MSTNTRPVSVIHLVLGLVFAGIATIWLIGNANGTDLPDLATGVPVVLIGAGIIGLVAALAGSGRRSRIDTVRTEADLYATEVTRRVTTQVDADLAAAGLTDQPDEEKS